MKKFFLLLVASTIFNVFNSFSQGIIKTSVPPRTAGQKDVLELRCAPIPTVRIGFIGIGMRGIGAVHRMMAIDGVEIKAICDLEQYNLDKAQEAIKKQNHPQASEYTGKNGWKELCERTDIDLIYICTDWETHTPMAVYAMEKGKHVAFEVPGATTVEECWQLVNTAEQTQRHCMMLENCCYDQFELATLNMAQQGVFGEIIHGEGAYIHDLRRLMFNPRLSDNQSYLPGIGQTQSNERGLAGYWNSWRIKYNEEHTGNAYPTHGFGPVCQIMNIHRGDKMNRLVSMSTRQIGLTEYAKKRFGEDSSEAKKDYKMGDMNTTLIYTEKGRTIMIQHDVTSPRPYSRLHVVSGTEGFAQKYPRPVMSIESVNGHSPLSKAAQDSILQVYEHPFYKEAGKRAKELGAIAHGGMDYIMDYRLIYCLRNGLPLDMDVYDAAEWSCLVELTEKSVLNNNAPIEIPDFTRGAWNKLERLKFAE